MVVSWWLWTISTIFLVRLERVTAGRLGLFLGKAPSCDPSLPYEKVLQIRLRRAFVILAIILPAPLRQDASPTHRKKQLGSSPETIAAMMVARWPYMPVVKNM